MLLSWQKDINEGTGRPEEDRAVESVTYLPSETTVDARGSPCERHDLSPGCLVLVQYVPHCRLIS